MNYVLTPGNRGRHLSYQRSRHVQTPGTSLIKIEGVDSTDAAKYVLSRRHRSEKVVANRASSFYCGKKIAYVYRGHKEIRGTKIRVIWGKVTRPHGNYAISQRPHCSQRLTVLSGNSGVVRAKFSSPLPTKSFGASVRVMLYPSTI